MKDIIIRFFDETISTLEKETLYSWLKESETNRKEFLELHSIWISSSLINKKFNAENAIELFVENIKHNDKAHKKRYPLKRVIQITTIVAATIALLFSVNYLARLNNYEEPVTAYTHVIKAQQLKESVMLPDGSIVWLNKGTILSYSDQFNVNKRQVKIEGKAFFDVAKDTHKPFIVDLGEDKIKVFGTSFNVRNYLNNKDIEIVLLTGAVELELAGVTEKIKLKPNEKVVYSKKSKESLITTVDANEFNIWTKDKLVFDNNTLSSVIPYLENWYDVDIECPQSVAENTMVSFTIINETKEQMLKVLALVAPVEYSVKNNYIYIRNKNK